MIKELPRPQAKAISTLINSIRTHDQKIFWCSVRNDTESADKWQEDLKKDLEELSKYGVILEDIY